jgi:hypothetical protein
MYSDDKPNSDAPADWRIIDDLDETMPISEAELDALEAFLAPLISAILAGETVQSEDRPKDYDLPQNDA